MSAVEGNINDNDNNDSDDDDQSGFEHLEPVLSDEESRGLVLNEAYVSFIEPIHTNNLIREVALFPLPLHLKRVKRLNDNEILPENNEQNNPNKYPLIILICFRDQWEEYAQVWECCIPFIIILSLIFTFHFPFSSPRTLR
eukprot:TRINITY_DN1251_c0_g1_i14.p1 TRINITY_DN1251_c0_g1~~TRINITY_DN1251_c0_g1_i14.p1  ORF type:complete len:141 (-),score=18.18 TRINITY_DN1251_c0_g1_i14:12-434(-)